MSSGRKKSNIQIYTNKGMSQENWNLEYKPRIDAKQKINLLQHKNLESDTRKPKKILINFFKWDKRKSVEKTNKNIRSSKERINITCQPLSPILISLETETAAESSNTKEEPVKDDFLEELKIHASTAIFTEVTLASIFLYKKKSEDEKFSDDSPRRNISASNPPTNRHETSDQKKDQKATFQS